MAIAICISSLLLKVCKYLSIAFIYELAASVQTDTKRHNKTLCKLT